jgi:hypothetical protein
MRAGGATDDAEPKKAYLTICLFVCLTGPHKTNPTTHKRILAMHRPTIQLAITLLTIAAPAAHATDYGKWVGLYAGGDSLDGWNQVGGGDWSIENGEIVGKTGNGKYGWLVTKKDYADFTLELDCRAESNGNSGIQFRSHVLDGVMHGWQADLDPPSPDRAGALYDEGGTRTWIAKADPAVIPAFKTGGWNHYSITCVGDHVHIEVNDVTAVDLHDPQFTSGVIALQVHVGKEPPVNVHWRNIRIKEFDPYKGFTPLFDGKTLKGWHVAGNEKWTVHNGEIVAQCKDKARYCYLLTDRTFGDFYAKLKFFYESKTGNSGFFFHATIEGVDINAPQAEISCVPGRHTGLIYAPAGRGWLDEADWTPLKDMVYRVDAWNELEVRTVGPHIQTWLNGYPITDVVDETLPRTGMIALQMHSGQAMKIRFKDLYIREIKNTEKK